MPAATADLETPPVGPSGYRELPFPPLKKSHILHCSVHYWYPKYRSLTPKARLIPLSNAFVDYLKADGIVLPPDALEASSSDAEFESEIPTNPKRSDVEDGDSDPDSEQDDADIDPSESWPEIHKAVQKAIADSGGKVAPKLNWSAPKDATWINPTNSMECRSANDVYLMLKSSDFVTHDLEHWDDGCAPSSSNLDIGAGGTSDAATAAAAAAEEAQPPYALFLRKFVQVNPSVEFRVFVRQRRILGICQRDVNHFDFLFDMVPSLRQLIQEFFEEKLKSTFPDESFVFDVYIPAPQKRVWLIDVNPWAVRTDPLLFSWLELLTMEGPVEDEEGDGVGMEEAFQRLEVASAGEGVVRLPLRSVSEDHRVNGSSETPPVRSDEKDVDEDVEEVFTPEFRLIKKDDPEAYSFNTPQYSAHKLPKDVVEASESGPGPLREFAEQWKEMLAKEGQR